MSELKPCPFCQSSEVKLNWSHDGGVPYFAGYCSKCGAEGPRCDDPEAGRSGWNTRAKPKWVKCSERMPEPETARLKHKHVPDGNGGQLLMTWRRRFIVAVRGNLEPLLAAFVYDVGQPYFQVVGYPGANVTHWRDEAIELPEE